MAFRNEDVTEGPRFGVMPEDVYQRRQLLAAEAEAQAPRINARLERGDVVYGEIPYITDPAVEEGRGFIMPMPTLRRADVEDVYPELRPPTAQVGDPMRPDEFHQMMEAMRQELVTRAMPVVTFDGRIRVKRKHLTRCAKCNVELGEADVAAAKCLHCGAFYNVPVVEPKPERPLVQCDTCDGMVLSDQLRVGYTSDGIEVATCEDCRHIPMEDRYQPADGEGNG